MLGHLKLNVDASMMPHMSQIGVRGVIQDKDGEIFDTFSQQIQVLLVP